MRRSMVAERLWRARWRIVASSTSSPTGAMVRSMSASPTISRRVSEHKAKLVPGFTQTYDIDRLVYAEEHASILEARAQEHRLERWRRAWKSALIEKLNPDWRDMSEEWLT
jgi:putative endonuclease